VQIEGGRGSLTAKGAKGRERSECRLQSAECRLRGRARDSRLKVAGGTAETRRTRRGFQIFPPMAGSRRMRDRLQVAEWGFGMLDSGLAEEEALTACDEWQERNQPRINTDGHGFTESNRQERQGNGGQ